MHGLGASEKTRDEVTGLVMQHALAGAMAAQRDYHRAA